MAAPAILRIVLQRDGHGDCAISALASLLGKSYEQVLVAAARSTKGDVLKGLNDDEFEATAKCLKAPVRKVAWEKVDEDEAVGLVEMQGRFNGEKYEHHLALLVEGRVVDLRDGTWRSTEAYFTHYAACPTWLWVKR